MNTVIYAGTDASLSNQGSWVWQSSYPNIVIMRVTDVAINSISIWGKTDGGVDRPDCSLKLQKSADNSNWIDVESWTFNQGSVTDWTEYSFSLSSPLGDYLTYPYIRIVPIVNWNINQCFATIQQTTAAVDGLLIPGGNNMIIYKLGISTSSVEWYMDIDNYPVTIPTATNCEPFTGFDDPYKILDVWKLDNSNDQFPWTFGWDAPAPVSSGWYIKTANGLSPVTWYIKTTNGLSPLRLEVRT